MKWVPSTTNCKVARNNWIDKVNCIKPHAP